MFPRFRESINMKKNFIQLSDFSLFQKHAQKEGFCMLHSAGILPSEKKTIIGINPIKKINQIPEGDEVPSLIRRGWPKAGGGRRLQGYIGHLAYPNPTLKNDIPSVRFYGFDSLLRLNTPEIRRRASACSPSDFKASGKLEQNVTKSQYIQKIKTIKRLLEEGEIYQLNFAIRFRKKFEGNPFALYLRMIEESPTDFSAFLNCGDYQILSASPERFFKVRNGKIITQPIKGTVSKKGGGKVLKAFLESEKERAELDMITDLERNDVGKICKYGTLRLTKEREILELKNLWHTYSEVQGDLPSNITPKQVIDAMFPGGSVTGCPKKRAMEYIEKLEGMPRNIFTGSIGYISRFITQIDMNIAIRTALIHNGYIEFWAGGGIVYDSDPEKEYEECLLKAEKFLSLMI